MPLMLHGIIAHFCMLDAFKLLVDSCQHVFLQYLYKAIVKKVKFQVCLSEK